MFKDYDGHNLRFHELSGTPEELGRAHAQCMKDAIDARISFFNEYTGTTEADLDNTPWYARERERDIEFHARAFPHMIDETRAIAANCDISEDRMFDLTFGGWGRIAGAKKQAENKACSIAAVTTQDGTPAMFSTLDDPPEIWPAIARYTSSDPGRRSFLTTARPGTAGTGRGMNDAGLWIGMASSGINATPGGPQESKRPYTLTYLLRAMLEQCADIDDALAFCRQYPFNCNMIFGDLSGRFVGIHQTLDGPRDVTGDGFAAMANSVVDDQVIYELAGRGLTCHESAPTSRPRHGYLLGFIRARNGDCDFEEFVAHIARRDPTNAWSINNHLTAYITLASPRKHPRTMWVCRPSDPINGADFIRLEV